MNWRELLQNRSQTREKWLLVRQAWQEFAWQVTMTFRFWFLKIFHKGIARWSVDTDMDQCGEHDVLVLLPRLWWPFGLDPRWVFNLRGFDGWIVNVSPDSLQAELWCHLEQHDPELADQLLWMNLFDVHRWAREHASKLHLPLVDYDYVTIADAMVKRCEAGQYVSAWFAKFHPQLAIAESQVDIRLLE
jgi:hypothetical protein